VLVQAGWGGAAERYGADGAKGVEMASDKKLTLEDAKAQAVWEFFRQISEIPRCSKHEERIVQWLSDFADEHEFVHRTDAVGNTVIELAATAGCEGAPGVILQCHVDMVCEKTAESQHDFSKDAIRLIEEKGWVRADGTTLGADNGVGVAMALGLAIEAELAHPKMELLFTVDEETGLIGAGALEAGFITGRYLINLDGEDESFIAGCAGGERTEITLKLDSATVPESFAGFTLEVTGLRGGHSGVDIDKQRANAIVVLAQTLDALKVKAEVRICGMEAGSASNAIPRDAKAVLCFDAARQNELQQVLDSILPAFKKQFAKTDPELNVTLSAQDSAGCEKAFSSEDTAGMVNLLLAIPHGVHRVSHEFDGVVETSSNLASVSTLGEQGGVRIVTSQRSFEDAHLDQMTQKVSAAAALAGADVKSSGRYPGWEPEPDSVLLQRAKKVYEEIHGRGAEVKVIHAGLECGVIGKKFENVQAISVGPTIKDAHSPAERVDIASVDNAYEFLVKLIPALK